MFSVQVKDLPTYPSSKPTFCPKWEVSVNVGLGEGWVGSSQKRIMIQDVSQQISSIGTFFNFNLSLPRARKEEETVLSSRVPRIHSYTQIPS